MDAIPPILSTADFERLLLESLGVSDIPPILDTATFRRLALQGIAAGGGGSSPSTVTAPSGINDFSTLPGGVAPTSGVYFAPRNISTLWTIEGGDSQWTVIDKNSP